MQIIKINLSKAYLDYLRETGPDAIIVLPHTVETTIAIKLSENGLTTVKAQGGDSL